MSLNLQPINISDEVSELVSKLNTNFQLIANSNGGPEGKQGNPGNAGLPGPRGPVGSQGAQGSQGSLWYAIASTLSFPNGARVGDYSVIKSNGDYYQLTVDGWSKIGTFDFSKGITIDLEQNSYRWDNGVVYTSIVNNIDTLINAKTNQQLLLTNIDRPDEDLGIQIQGNDTPGDSYPFIITDGTNKLDDYKIMIYNSGNSSDDSEKVYGRNLHLANSYSTKTKEGWKLASGFTFDVNLAPGDANENGDGIEILQVVGQTSGNPSHLHRIQVDNSSFWVSNFRVGKDSKVSIGFSDSYTPSQMLDVNGAILIGDSNVEKNNTIRITNNQVQARLNDTWVNLGLQVSDFITYLKQNQDSFKDVVIDTTAGGGIIVGDLSQLSTNKAGAIRYKDGKFEGYNGTKWINLTNGVNLNSDGTLVDGDGGTVANKIAVNSNDSKNAGNLIYQGVVLTSQDKSVEITQSVLESKYAVLDLSASGGGGQFIGPDGKTVNANGMDIVSEDMTIKKEVVDGLMQFKLKLRDTQTFKDAVNKAFDLRSTNESLSITPPGTENKFWDLKIPEKILDALNNAANGKSSNPSVLRYTDNSSTFTMDYIPTHSGYVGYLPFDNKDFDQNCNITSTDPLTITTTKEENGFFDIACKVRFTIDSDPSGGTFASVRLCVFKDNIIISELAKLRTTDIIDITANNVKQYELSGSDLVDLSCIAGDCDNTIKIGLVADFGTTADSAGATIVDSYVSMYKIGLDGAAITSLNSKAAFQKLELLDANANVTATVQSNVALGALQLAYPDYLDMSISANVLNIDANIAKLTTGIDPSGKKLAEGFSSIILDGAYTYDATSNNIIEFEAGDYMEISLTGNKYTFTGKPNPMVVYANANIVSNTITNVIFDDNFDVSNVSGNVVVSLSSTYDKNSTERVHVYTNYHSGIGTFGAGTAEDTSKGIINYNDYITNKAVAIKYVTSSEEILNDNLGNVTNAALTDAFILTPYEDGDYTISTIVGFNVVGVNKGISPSKKYYPQDKAHVSLGLFEVGSGSYSLKLGGNSVNATLIKIMGGLESTITYTKEYNSSTTKFNGNRITASTVLSLVASKKYALGVISGNDLTTINVLSKDASTLNLKSILAASNLKTLLYDADVSIVKLK